jgi:hypothetical protein
MALIQAQIGSLLFPYIRLAGKVYEIYWNYLEHQHIHNCCKEPDLEVSNNLSTVITFERNTNMTPVIPQTSSSIKLQLAVLKEQMLTRKQGRSCIHILGQSRR